MPVQNRKKALLFLFFTLLIDIIGLGIIIPVTPKLVMALTHQPISEASTWSGWLLFVYAGMQFLCAPIAGALSDRFGRRPVLLLSLLAFGLDSLLTGFAPKISWLFIGRALAGSFGAAYAPASAYIADVSPPEERAQNFGFLGAAFGLGFIIGPVLGGLLGQYGPRVPFFAAAGLAFANATYGYFVLPESLPLDRRRPFSWRRANTLGSLVQLAQKPMLLSLGIIAFLHQLAHQVLPCTWSFFGMARFGWTEREVGYSLGAIGLSIALVQGGLMRRVIPKLGPARSASVGLVFAIIAYTGYAFADSERMVYVFMLPMALGGLVGPSIQGWMSSRTEANAQGELQGALSSLSGLTAILGPPLMTQLFGRFNAADAPVHFPGAAFAAASILELFALFGLLHLLLRPGSAQGAAPVTTIAQ